MIIKVAGESPTSAAYLRVDNPVGIVSAQG